METDKLKNYFWLFLNLVLLAIFVNITFFVMPALKRYTDSFFPVRTINVSAEGKATVSPDIAETSFSVVSRGKDPETLADTNNDKVTSAINFVKSQGVEAKDIKTTGYNLNPDYQYDSDTQRSFITGYTLTQTVSVKIRELDKVAKIVGGLPPVGVNQIGGISFTVDDPDKYLEEARTEAYAKARAKAELMAKNTGVKLGNVVNVSEYGGVPPIPYYAERAMGMGGDVAMLKAPTIEPGTQDITLQVSITYELK